MEIQRVKKITAGVSTKGHCESDWQAEGETKAISLLLQRDGNYHEELKA